MPEQRISAELRQQVTERAHTSCEYCRSQARYATQPFSVEHIIPRAKSGPTTLENLALACQGCNNHKYDKVEAPDPVSGEIVPLYHPRHDRWDIHFAWSDDFTLIVGLTPTGRATVATLLLNREGVVNLRRLLAAIGAHPPLAVSTRP
jgi:5-methylcytosine-specific restriction endonuclease McrA